MNEQDVIRKAMAILGSRTSAAKKRSSRLNGAKRKAKLIKLDWPKTGWTVAAYLALPLKEKKYIASRLVNLALKQQGLYFLKTGHKCKPCNGSPGYRQIVAHHPDYDKPMEVELMCAACHTKLHRPPRSPYAKSGKQAKIKLKRKVAQANG